MIKVQRISFSGKYAMQIIPLFTPNFITARINLFSGNLDRLREELQNVFGLIRHHPPALTYRRVCHALAWTNLHLEGTCALRVLSH